MGNPRKLSRADLVLFATNAATGIADGKVSGFSAAQNTAFSDALTDATALLSSADLSQVELHADALEATQIADDAEEVVQNLLADYKFAIRSVNSGAAEYDAIGFDPPDTTRSPVVPQSPTDLVATAVANGTNALKFNGNNKSGSVVYAIEVKIGDTAPFVLINTTSAQKFKHTGVTRGEYYEYRVRAQSARGLVSEWSNSALVYGM